MNTTRTYECTIKDSGRTFRIVAVSLCRATAAAHDSLKAQGIAFSDIQLRPLAETIGSLPFSSREIRCSECRISGHTSSRTAKIPAGSEHNECRDAAARRRAAKGAVKVKLQRMATA